MIDRLVGPYRLRSLLGTGGMGSVYLAEAEGEGCAVPVGTRVALKVVHAHLVGHPELVERFLREAALGRRVDHEHVVRTFDAGTEVVDGVLRPWLAMELVVGRSLRQLVAELHVVPEALVREIGMQAAAALEAVHALGVVHRDVKPDNLMLTADDRIRLADLGVARALDATASLTLEGQFAGSLPYAAPEAFHGAPPGPETDLYALGVVLHELTSGSNPFERPTPAAMIEAHLREIAPRLDAAGVDASPFLCEVVATLLAKSPDARFPSARVLRETLEAGEKSPWWAAHAASVPKPSGQTPRIAVTRDTSLHGRATELAILADAWTAARAGKGSLVLLEGEAGIGKTRLVDAFLRGLTADEAQVLYGSFPPEGGLRGLADAVLGRLGPSRLEAGLMPRLGATASLAPALAALLEGRAPPPTAAPIVGEALSSLFVELLRSFASERPVVWVVDDLHFAPPEARKAVLALARALADLPALLVVTMRPGIPESELAVFARGGRTRRVPLGRLSPREVVELLREAFGDEVLAERLGGKIAHKSDGVPFFVLEMLRGLEEGRFLQRRGDGTFVETRPVEELTVPSAVLDLVASRLKVLQDEDRDLLDAACIQGFEFDPDLLSRVVDRKRVQVLQRLAALERATGLVRAAGRLFRFDHHQVQEVLYGALAPGLREEYHALLASAVREREGSTEADASKAPGEVARLLAHHSVLAGRPEEALPWLDGALEHLERLQQNAEAARLASLVLAAPGLLPLPRRLDLLLRRATRLDGLGRREEERAALEEAAQVATSLGTPSARARVQRALAVHLWRTARYLDAEAAAKAACAAAVEAGDRRTEAAAIGTLGLVAVSTGRYAEAWDHHERQLELATIEGDRKGEAVAYGNLGNVAWYLGRYEEARTRQAACLALTRELKDRAGEARAAGNLALVLSALGRLEEARPYHEEQLRVSREIGDRQGEASATRSQASTLLQLGLLAEAGAALTRGLSLAQEIGDRHGEAITLVNVSTLKGHLGDDAGSREAALRSRELAREIGDRRVESYGLDRLAHALERAGDVAEAEARALEALEMRRAISYRRGIADTQLLMARLHVESGRTEAAQAAIVEVLTIARALGLPGPAARARALAALLPGAGRAESAEALYAFAQVDELLGAPERMEARWLLFQATRDPAHLVEARRLLDHLVAHAPPAARGAMVDRVPLHRALVDAGS